MTQPFTSEPADFGDFDYKVKVFKRYITVSNVRMRDLVIKKETDCDCWINISHDYKRFTAKDLTTLATNMYGADMFATLYELKEAATKKAVTPEDTKRATDAQNALKDLAPTGKSWQQYADMINTVYVQNEVTYKAKLSENHIWLLNGLRDDFAQAKLNGTLDKKKLEELASDIKTVRGFTRLVKNASFCNETEEFVDAKDGLTKKRWTAAAKHGQKILTALASPNLRPPEDKPNQKPWEILYDIISDVEFNKRATWLPLIDKLNKQEDAKAKATSSVTLSPFDLSSIQPEEPISDQQMTSVLSTLKIAPNAEGIILPPEVKNALAIQGKNSSFIAA